MGTTPLPHVTVAAPKDRPLPLFKLQFFAMKKHLIITCRTMR